MQQLMLTNSRNINYAWRKISANQESFYVREAIVKHLDDMEEVYLAVRVLERVRRGEEKTYTLDEVEARLGLAG